MEKPNMHPKLAEILERNRIERELRRQSSRSETKKTLEEMFGKEVAARMRAEAEKNKRTDNLKD